MLFRGEACLWAASGIMFIHTLGDLSGKGVGTC